MPERVYIAIDLKSFYASVECVERRLDPLTTHLTVADLSRTSKTICLAVSPALKAYGVPGRARLFELMERVDRFNARRRLEAPGQTFTGKTWDDTELRRNPALALDYIVAPPRMAHYLAYSTRIYGIYLKYVSPEDIHVYSVDEVFIDATGYLKLYRLTPRQFAEKLIREVLLSTGITATAGIGTNLYLAKVAMDIVAKHIPPDEAGVRIAELDEMSYRELLWRHQPLTDFWRIGRGYARKLERMGLHTMEDICRFSMAEKGKWNGEDVLFRTFGKNAEFLIDHAWGQESCTMADIKAYHPTSNSISSGQVLTAPYSKANAGIVLREMADSLSLDLVEKGVVSDQLVLSIGFDVESLSGHFDYHGPVCCDFYGRMVPEPAHGSKRLKEPTASTEQIVSAALDIFDRIVPENLLVRRMSITANHVVPADSVCRTEAPTQLSLFIDVEAEQRAAALREQRKQRERRQQQALLAIKRKYGKNAILRGTSFLDGATARERNGQIGGHKA